MENGASSWLSALPIKAVGYAPNKQEFTDAICVRYGWKVKGIPTHCACGETNSLDHKPHMQTRWLHFNEAQLSERLWGTDNERGL